MIFIIDCEDNKLALVLGIVATFILTLVVTTLISVIITGICYKRRYKHKRIQSVKENYDEVIYQNNEIVETKLSQRDHRGEDNDGYIIPQGRSAHDSNPIYDTVN